MKPSGKLAALSIAGLLAVVGCYGTAKEPARSANIAKAPSVALPESAPRNTTAQNTPTREPKRGDVYDTQKGFEDSLPPPDARGGGPSTDSDIGKPRWRNNPGSYDDRTDTGRAMDAQRRRESAPAPAQRTGAP